MGSGSLLCCLFSCIGKRALLGGGYGILLVRTSGWVVFVHH